MAIQQLGPIHVVVPDKPSDERNVFEEILTKATGVRDANARAVLATQIKNADPAARAKLLQTVLEEQRALTQQQASTQIALEGQVTQRERDRLQALTGGTRGGRRSSGGGGGGGGGTGLLNRLVGKGWNNQRIKDYGRAQSVLLESLSDLIRKRNKAAEVNIELSPEQQADEIANIDASLARLGSLLPADEASRENGISVLLNALDTNFGTLQFDQIVDFLSPRFLKATGTALETGGAPVGGGGGLSEGGRIRQRGAALEAVAPAREIDIQPPDFGASQELVKSFSDFVTNEIATGGFFGKPGDPLPANMDPFSMQRLFGISPKSPFAKLAKAQGIAERREARADRPKERGLRIRERARERGVRPAETPDLEKATERLTAGTEVKEVDGLKGGTYAAEGDPHIYTLNDDGSVTITRDGKQIFKGTEGTQFDAAKRQMESGQLESKAPEEAARIAKAAGGKPDKTEKPDEKKPDEKPPEKPEEVVKERLGPKEPPTAPAEKKEPTPAKGERRETGVEPTSGLGVAAKEAVSKAIPTPGRRREQKEGPPGQQPDLTEQELTSILTSLRGEGPTTAALDEFGPVEPSEAERVQQKGEELAAEGLKKEQQEAQKSEEEKKRREAAIRRLTSRTFTPGPGPS